MADIILDTDELSVLGGPSTISLDVGIGPQGTRGSQIFVGSGQPNDPDTVIGQTPNIFDLYINLAPADDEYRYLYQYQNVDGSDTWVKLLNLVPESYSDNNTVEFDTGVGTVNIPVSSITGTDSITNITGNDFNVQATIVNDNPCALTVSVAEDLVDFGGTSTIEITINAIEYESSAWSDLGGTRTVYLLITMV